MVLYAQRTKTRRSEASQSLTEASNVLRLFPRPGFTKTPATSHALAATRRLPTVYKKIKAFLCLVRELSRRNVLRTESSYWLQIGQQDHNLASFR